MADLDVMLSNQASKVVHVGGEWITPRLAILVLRRRFVTATERLVERWPVGGIILAGKTEVDEKVSCRAPSPRIPFCRMAKVLASPYLNGVEGLRIHI